MNVLIVDDEEEYVKVLRAVFQEEGWTVFTAANGLQALDILEDEKIDVIVSDIYMPVLDGIKLRKKVRRHPRYAKCPFLFTSGYDDEETRSLIEQPAIETCVRKTKPIHDLVAWIRFLTTPVDRRKGSEPANLSNPLRPDHPLPKPRAKRK